MGRNELFLAKAKSLEPKLFRETVSCRDVLPVTMKAGDSITLDFGNHFVGRLSLHFSTVGSHFDAPGWIRIKFAERLSELEEDAEEYHGWISKGWIQQEQVHIDVFPVELKLPRRYAFRYVRVEVLDASSKYSIVFDDAFCEAVTSADDNVLQPLKSADPRLVRLDSIACRTLRNCMQSVFEDGPKRDRRLWMGDLRMQALVNYETYRNYELVKRCLYLFAGTTMEQDKVGACLFLEPAVEADDTDMFDYALFYIPTLLNYFEATGDSETVQDLYPTAIHQLDIARQRMDSDGIIMDSDLMNWCFVDWNLNLNKQASAMGIYLYCLDAAERLARKLNTEDSFAEELKNLRQKAAESFWDKDRKVFVSGAEHQISWASQVWMVLGGVITGKEAVDLLNRIEQIPEAQRMATPYIYHNYLDALMAAGMSEKALCVLKDYWGGMADQGADTFWELYDPNDPDASPYGGTIVNSYCHAWSCAPAYFLRKYFQLLSTGGDAGAVH